MSLIAFCESLPRVILIRHQGRWHATATEGIEFSEVEWHPTAQEALSAFTGKQCPDPTPDELSVMNEDMTVEWWVEGIGVEGFLRREWFRPWPVATDPATA